jgi:hypothetical protein
MVEFYGDKPNEKYLEEKVLELESLHLMDEA